jgi:hypothetical protein
MKTFAYNTLIIAFLLLCAPILQAQTQQTKLNQVELLKQILGTWKVEMAKDTTMILNYTLFGTGIEENGKIVTNGRMLNEEKELWGYDKKEDKIMYVQLWKSSPKLTLAAEWFSSKNILEAVLLKDISHPENADLKYKVEFKSPDIWVMTTIQNGKVIGTLTATRLKN